MKPNGSRYLGKLVDYDKTGKLKQVGADWGDLAMAIAKSAKLLNCERMTSPNAMWWHSQQPVDGRCYGRAIPDR